MRFSLPFGMWSLFLIAPGSASASIVNVMSPSVGELEDGLGAQLGLQLAHDSGNEEKWKAGGLAGLRWVKDSQAFLFKASVERGATFGMDTTDKGFAHARYRWEFSDPWRAFTFVQVDHNGFRDLLVRDLAGLGIERRLWRTERSEASFGTAVMSEHEILGTGGTSPLGFRSSSYFLAAIDLGEGLNFGSTTFFQPRVDDLEDWRLLEDLVLSVGISEHLSWTASWKLEIDSAPPEGIGQWDSSTRSGLSFRW